MKFRFPILGLLILAALSSCATLSSPSQGLVSQVDNATDIKQNKLTIQLEKAAGSLFYVEMVHQFSNPPQTFINFYHENLNGYIDPATTKPRPKILSLKLITDDPSFKYSTTTTALRSLIPYYATTRLTDRLSDSLPIETQNALLKTSTLVVRIVFEDNSTKEFAISADQIELLKSLSKPQ